MSAPDLAVRAATPADVEAVTALERAAFGTESWSAASVAQELVGEHRLGLVAVDDRARGGPGDLGEPGGEPGEVVGYAVVLVLGDTADLQRICTAAGRRRTGVATALLDTLLARCAETGLRRVVLEVGADNAAARALYEAQGFAEIARRRRYYRDGGDAVVMQRRLSAGGR